MKKNQPHSWRPILDGELGEAATEALQEIAADLLVPHPKLTSDQGARDTSLAGGKAGMAVFYTYLSQTLPNSDSEQSTALVLLEEAIDALTSVPMHPSLYGGFTGTAWTVEHLQGRLLDPDEEDPNEPIDEELIAFLNKSPWREDYDLISGLVGFGVYALERLPRPAAVKCLSQIIDRLDETASRLPEGISWHTSPDLLPDHQREICPEGYYNLGLAHGMPGVIALLGAACAAKVSVDKARPLLEGAVKWLLAQKLMDESNLSFASWVVPGVESTPSRLAWCYGDAGVAAALFYAARVVNEPTWEREAIEIALRASNCSFERSRIIDPGLCHGAAGLGHIFNRFFQATGEPRLKESAQFWFRKTLDMRQPNQGIAGFSAWLPQKDGKNDWVDDPGLLTGATGIGLALLAATTSIEPEWDRILLVSIPPRS
jgi:lantibiotic biosynthesis protein